MLTFAPGVEEDELHSAGVSGRYPARMGSFVQMSNYRFSHKFLTVLWRMAFNGGQRWRPSGGHG